jgi:predicted permease
MRWRHLIYVIPLRLRSILRRSQVELELDEEVRFHLERLIEQELAGGRTPEEARYVAVRAMGGVEQRKEECRDARRVDFFDDMVRDLRYAVRQLRRNRGFALLAIVIMALAIGATTAVFSVVNAVILRPLPYPDSDQLVTFANSLRTNTATESIGNQVSIANFQDWRAQAKSFDAMAYYTSRETSVTSGAAAEYVHAARVSADFFRVFAVKPIFGRLFTAEETKVGSSETAIVSYAYWQSHFGHDPRPLGQTIRLYRNTVPIVGVLPAGFHFPNGTDVWSPATTSTHETTQSRSANNYLAVGRLKRHVRLEQAQSELDSIAARLEQQYPDSNKGRGVAVTRMLDQMVADVRVTLYLLLGAVAVLLLIACANTAALLLGKAATRTREVALRSALGAMPATNS